MNFGEDKYVWDQKRNAWFGQKDFSFGNYTVALSRTNLLDCDESLKSDVVTYINKISTSSPCEALYLLYTMFNWDGVSYNKPLPEANLFPIFEQARLAYQGLSGSQKEKEISKKKHIVGYSYNSFFFDSAILKISSFINEVMYAGICSN